MLLLWLAGFGLDGSLATAGTLRWQGVSWPVVAGTTLVVALLALCFYSFRELSSTRSELAAAERQAGILGERQRIAGDIHDTLTQGLASIVMLLEAAQAAYQAGQPEAGRRIEEAARTAREGLQDVRRLVWDLRPEPLERGTPEEALARLTAQLEEQTGMAAQMVVTGEAGAIAPQVEVTLLRVAQEALANVRRHAHAREVTITLSYMENDVALDVQDDGRGFHPAMLIGASPGGGLGLTAMRERVESPRRDIDRGEHPGGGRNRGRPVAKPDANPALDPGPVACRRPPPMSLRVLLADDHQVVRAGLRAMLDPNPDIEVVGEAGDGAEAVGLVRDLDPDVVPMDLRMPKMDGVAAIGRIREVAPAIPVLVLTTYGTDADIVRAIEAGATGYLLKDTTREEPLGAIRSAAAGRSALAPSVASRLVARMAAPAGSALSAREIEVLELVARGRSNKEIARLLHLGEATVKTHLVHSFSKLGVEDRTEAVMAALDRGIIRLSS